MTMPTGIKCLCTEARHGTVYHTAINRSNKFKEMKMCRNYYQAVQL